MKSVSTILLLLFLTIGNAQTSLEYARVKINLQTCSAQQLAKLGLEVDHGQHAPGKFLTNDYSNQEIALLKANNIGYEILIQDVKQWYKDQNKPGNEHFHPEKTGNNCFGDGIYQYNTPVNYQDGSMGGYLTYSELLVELDKMTTLYPNLITAKTPISNTVLTQEGRPIYYLRISDNPNIDEPEPEVLYSALHHAREPNSLSQMVFYMWYLLENYASDSEIQYLVNETEMYFVPCVNPDGYVYNELTDPNGGGLWRKNRKTDTSGTVYGVDLNRNYGYQWGFDNNGSSPNPNNETYRGDAGFSEPETQNLKLLCDNHNFRIALNYHCFGNLLIYPWGYNSQPTSDFQIFTAMSEAMTRENNFLAGLSGATIGYIVNGSSDDWMYGENISKPAIFSLTPEVGPGNYGFWPPQSAIDQLNKSCMFQNLTAAHLLLNYGIIQEINPQPIVNNLTGDLEIEIEKLGLTNGNLLLDVTTISSNVVVNTSQQTLNIAAWTKDSVSFNYTIDNTINPGDSVVFVVSLANGLHTFTDTIARIFGINFNPIYQEDGNDITEWQADFTWGQTTEEAFSVPSSITDSPFSAYGNGRSDYITLTTIIDLTNAQTAEATFYAKWDIEDNYDYVQFQAAPIGGSYTALCGLYTETGEGIQPTEPVYDGLQQTWVKEKISLDSYIGSQVQFRFHFVSDNFVTMDGFYFDDFTISSDLPINTGIEPIEKEAFQLILQPNPAHDLLIVQLREQSFTEAQITIYNGLGQSVFSELFTVFSLAEIPVSDWARGLYLVEYRSGNQLVVEKLLIH